MTISVGDTLPEFSFKVMGENGPEAISTKDLTAGSTVAIFSVPGAFTPTCSVSHLPGFIDNLDALRAKGVDKVACVSVNDVFVMDAWGKSQSVGKDILMLADGNAEFAELTGTQLDGRGFGMGPRSKRYSMLVKDGKVVQMNIEEGGEFKVSSAEYMLSKI
ncbi:peroxiredoxin [Hirschia litorea]|uniref:Glutathione-dependent peroxiredoxin n=1 Tax=Hirschia litorea TaxID=1199156 RepID=A0ABW2IJL1_9PROT